MKKKEFTYSRVGEGDIERDNEKWAKMRGWLDIWNHVKKELKGDKKR